MEDRQLDRKISREEAAVKPMRSFRYEDYNTRRVFLRSYPLQWGSSPAPGYEKQVEEEEDDDDDGYESCGERRWKRQVVVAVVEWGEEKMSMFRRVKKRLALYLLGCSYGRRPALTYKSGGSCTTAMLASR